ncbi:hypothetical protein ACIRL3_38775 [Streptomyces sp. NPDC102384]|uniref:hypothetical protein n=1 Tax=Streptomyces sp. NPDC102384 TaxID=3366166 RepID=UPI00382FD849
MRLASRNPYPAPCARRGLWLLSAVVEDWGGKWDVLDPRSPPAKSLTWIDLPN